MHSNTSERLGDQLRVTAPLHYIGTEVDVGFDAVGQAPYGPARAGRKGDRVATRPDMDQPNVDQPNVELDAGMDPDYVEFFTAVLPQAVTAARRITGDLGAAEDAASEALAKAYLRWPKLRSLAYRNAWVLRVATNEAIGTVRKQARRELILRRQPSMTLVADEAEEARQSVVDQVHRLPIRQRQVVMLRFYADLSTDEVASALGISAGAVKSHLHRAVHTLRQRLGTDVLGGTPE